MAYVIAEPCIDMNTDYYTLSHEAFKEKWKIEP
jgi:hypothetical protein